MSEYNDFESVSAQFEQTKSMHSFDYSSGNFNSKDKFRSMAFRGKVLGGGIVKHKILSHHASGINLSRISGSLQPVKSMSVLRGQSLSSIHKSSWRIKRDQVAVGLYKQELVSLRKALGNNKLFLNMVIHDIRHPTNQINFSIAEAMEIVKHSLN